VRRILAIAGSATLLAAAVAAIPFAARRDPLTAKVQVHCPSGAEPSFVSPAQLKIAVGDSVQWKITGAVGTDTLIITLKDPAQPWPFSGPMPTGRNSAQTGASLAKGTFGYNVTLECKAAAGRTESVTIDPDVIIE